MLASSGESPAGDGWVAEVKWDGFRIVATVAAGSLSLRSRPGSHATDCFPELAELPPGLEGREAVLDGEVVIAGPTGARPSTSCASVLEDARATGLAPRSWSSTASGWTVRPSTGSRGTSGELASRG
jgi:hypothetical protein